MKKHLLLIATILITAVATRAQPVTPGAGQWKTWFIPSGKSYRLPPPPSSPETAAVLTSQQQIDAGMLNQIIYWNTGAPGFHWHQMMAALWMNSFGATGALANMLLNTAMYDATVAAWDTKYAYNRARPFTADKQIRSYTVTPQSPSYPCEYSVAAGAATTIIAHFFPKMADSANKMAQQVMASRIAAGVAYPSDTRAGFELGRRIASQEIANTKNHANTTEWDGKTPGTSDTWKGKFALLPNAGLSKTVVLTSGSQFRPGPPPDFAKDMAELKNYQQTFESKFNALYYASQDFWGDLLNQKILEHNLHLDPPRAARLYAIAAVAYYDGFTAIWDAKYAYWGIRPNQYDTSYKPLVGTPPFPGYPSGHAALSATMAELYGYFFPADKAWFVEKAKEVAESRFQAGIHFRTDNEVALVLGKQVADEILKKIKQDGAEDGYGMLIEKLPRPGKMPVIK